MSYKHIFALYLQTLEASCDIDKKLFSCKNKELWHRVVTVLRLGKNDEIEFFDGTHVCRIRLLSGREGAKYLLEGIIEYRQRIIPDMPEIILCIGLTKRDAFHEIVYAAGQLGVMRVVPLISRRIHKNWWSEKEAFRCFEHMKAGAEQAKSYMIGQINDPIKIQELSEMFFSDNISLLCEVSSERSLITVCRDIHNQSVILFVGPEAGFDSDEIAQLYTKGVQPARLTRSILRARDAALLSLGIIRTACY